MKKEEKKSYPTVSDLYPYFLYLKSYWVPFTGALFLEFFMELQVVSVSFHDRSDIPQIFPSTEDKPLLSSWEIFIYVCWFPLVFLIRGVSSFFNAYLINFCGMKVLERIRVQVFTKIQHLPMTFFSVIKPATCSVV